MTGIIEGIVLVIAALGLRDAIKLYIRKKEGCGSPKCKEFIIRTCTPLNASVTTDSPPGGSSVTIPISNTQTDMIPCPEELAHNTGNL